MLRKAFLAGGVVAALMPGPALATELFRYVSETIRRAETQWGNRPIAQQLGYQIILINRGYQANGSILSTVPANVTVVAACDSDCNQMRITVVDYLNNPVNTRTGLGGASEVSFFAAAGQTYRIQALPLDCRTPTCWVVWSAAR